MNILDRIKKERLFFDGALGSLLQTKGLLPGEKPEAWNLLHEDVIYDIHLSYLEAGANIIKTNTFGANCTKFDNYDTVIEKGCAIAKRAVAAFGGNENSRYVAFDMGPLGRMLKPLGDLEFEDAVEIFAKSVRVAAECGVDLILIETLCDSLETKAAVLAAKENSTLPVFVTNAYDKDELLLGGSSPECMVAMLEGLRVDALGINCSLGPAQMKNIVRRLVSASSLPIIVNPNAGLPDASADALTYSVDADEFAKDMCDIAALGATVLGGCCGTSPLYIKKTKNAVTALPYTLPSTKKRSVVSSNSKTVLLGNRPRLIGERINPTGKPRLKAALSEDNIDYILSEAIGQTENGADILDINVGLPGIDERDVLCRVVKAVGEVSELPLCIDTVDPKALMAAMRCYNGKPLVNSVCGKQEIMDAVFPIVAKYGGVVIALTLDENGIPSDADGRVRIAENILRCAESYGIGAHDLIFDTLAMTVSADQKSALVTLEALRRIKELGLNTVLGVSNISFGLPNREFITSSFFAMALQAGLDAAIMNPNSAEMQKSFHSSMALLGFDDDCLSYIDFATGIESSLQSKVKDLSSSGVDANSLSFAIAKGLRERSYAIAKEMLKTVTPLDLINTEIVPALNAVGEDFENKKVFLPQLLLSAEAAKSAFGAAKESMSGSGTEYGKVILATVLGDIHDIGKNIVKVLLENYGFSVLDLGRDVAPDVICAKAIENNIKFVGLSALMTTTVGAMRDTVELLHKTDPEIKIVVGGAVLTKEFAESIGADCYAKDAMETVRHAQKHFGIQNI